MHLVDSGGVTREVTTMSNPNNTHRIDDRRDAVLERDHHQCQNCYRTASEASLRVHQIVPREGGGTRQLTNLVTLCETCHEGATDGR